MSWQRLPPNREARPVGKFKIKETTKFAPRSVVQPSTVPPAMTLALDILLQRLPLLDPVEVCQYMMAKWDEEEMRDWQRFWDTKIPFAPPTPESLWSKYFPKLIQAIVEDIVAQHPRTRGVTEHLRSHLAHLAEQPRSEDMEKMVADAVRTRKYSVPKDLRKHYRLQ